MRAWPALAHVPRAAMGKPCLLSHRVSGKHWVFPRNGAAAIPSKSPQVRSRSMARKWARSAPDRSGASAGRQGVDVLRGERLARARRSDHSSSRAPAFRPAEQQHAADDHGAAEYLPDVQPFVEEHRRQHDGGRRTNGAADGGALRARRAACPRPAAGPGTNMQATPRIAEQHPVVGLQRAHLFERTEHREMQREQRRPRSSWRWPRSACCPVRACNARRSGSRSRWSSAAISTSDAPNRLARSSAKSMPPMAKKMPT